MPRPPRRIVRRGRAVARRRASSASMPSAAMPSAALFAVVLAGWLPHRTAGAGSPLSPIGDLDGRGHGAMVAAAVPVDVLNAGVWHAGNDGVLAAAEGGGGLSHAGTKDGRRASNDMEGGGAVADPFACVNCHILFRVRVAIDGRRRASSSATASNPWEEPWEGHTWSLALEHLGHGEGLLRMDHPLDVQCERGSSLEGTGEGVPSSFVACRSVANLLVPYSSLVNISDPRPQAPRAEVVVLASLLRGSNSTRSSTKSDGARRVVDRRLVHVVVPAAGSFGDGAKGHGGFEGGVGGGGAELYNPIYPLKLTDRLHLDEWDSSSDPLPQSSGQDLRMIGIACLLGMIPGILVLATAWRLMKDGEAIDEVEGVEEEREPEMVEEGEAPVFRTPVRESSREIPVYPLSQNGVRAVRLFPEGASPERDDDEGRGDDDAAASPRSEFEVDEGVVRGLRKEAGDAPSPGEEASHSAGDSSPESSGAESDCASHGDHAAASPWEDGEDSGSEAEASGAGSEDDAVSDEESARDGADALQMETYSPKSCAGDEDHLPLGTALTREEASNVAALAVSSAANDASSNALSIEEVSSIAALAMSSAANDASNALSVEEASNIAARAVTSDANVAGAAGGATGAASPPPLETYSPQFLAEDAAPLPHSNTLSMEEGPSFERMGDATDAAAVEDSAPSPDRSNTSREENADVAIGGAEDVAAKDTASPLGLAREEESDHTQVNDAEEATEAEADGENRAKDDAPASSSNSPLLEEGTGCEEEVDSAVVDYDDETCSLQQCHFASNESERDGNDAMDANARASSPDQCAVPLDRPKRHTPQPISYTEPSVCSKLRSGDVPFPKALPTGDATESVRELETPESTATVIKREEIEKEQVGGRLELAQTDLDAGDDESKHRGAITARQATQNCIEDNLSDKKEGSLESPPKIDRVAVTEKLPDFNPVDAETNSAEPFDEARASPREPTNPSVSSSAVTERTHNGQPKAPATPGRKRTYSPECVPSKSTSGKRQCRSHDADSARVSTSPCARHDDKENQLSPVNTSGLDRDADDASFGGEGGFGGDSSPGRAPLSNRGLFAYPNNNCPSPSSTVAATVHDFDTKRRKSSMAEVRDRPIPLPCGSAGQSKRFGASPTHMHSSQGASSRSNSDEVDFSATGGSEDDSQERGSKQRGDDLRRKKVRSKKKKRSIEKKLLATQKNSADHKPSSALIPLSQKVEEPAWEFQEEVSSEKSY